MLAKIKLLVPGELGLFGAADAGRVIFAEDPDDADTVGTLAWEVDYGCLSSDALADLERGSRTTAMT